VPSDEAKAEVIWEAFKPETEPTRVTRQEQVVAKRSELLDAIRRGFNAVSGKGNQNDQPGDFAGDQGGVY
jgi:penicillin-binding protein 1A